MNKEQSIIGYKGHFTWIGLRSDFNTTPLSDEEIRCAACGKSKAEIKKTEDPDVHIENHIYCSDEDCPVYVPCSVHEKGCIELCKYYER